MKNMLENNRFKLLSAIVLCIISLMSIFCVTTNYKKSVAFVQKEVESYRYYNNNSIDSLYLSDIEYVANMSYASWDKIRYDEVSNGSKITVKIENNSFTFDKGIWAHATSQVTYNVSELDYKYFTAFIGLNTTAASSSNGVKFRIYTSQDGKEWIPQTDEILKKPGENATFIKVDIEDAVYLRLIAGDNGSNGNDHAVYADAKLVNNIDESSNFKSVAEYNELIKTKYPNQTNISGELEHILLQRDLVKNTGQYTLNSFYNASPENKEVIDWLMSDQEVLRYYILGGSPNGGSYYNSLSVLSRLYYNYKEDFKNSKLLNNQWEPNVTVGDVYLKLAISISLTHSETVGLWMWSGPKENQSEPVRRYAIYKYLYDNDGFKANNSTDMTSWFEAMKVEEMRFVVQNMIDDEEILWLNSYVKTRIAENNGNVGSLLTPHPYLAYVWPDYNNNIYYTNDDYFNELFAVNKTSNNVGKELVDANGNATGKIGLWDSEFVIPGNKDVSEYRIKITKGTTEYKLTKLWMNFRNKFGTGAVCGGISKSGSNIRNVFAIPATVIGQPGHAALLYYGKTADGRGSWGIDNDVSGWTQSEKGERLLLGWGNGSYSRGFFQVVYMQLGQEAINDFDNLVKAEELVKLASVYEGDLDKQEEIYRKALSFQKINFDAWLGLIDVYNNGTTKTEDDYYELAEEIADGLKLFPLPMYNLTNLIKPKLKSIENDYKFTLLQTRTLTYASQLPNSETAIVSPGLTRTEANYLLGQMDKTIATFSFDGENAGKIVLASRFDGSGVRWDYSLDGKNNWKEVSFTGEEPHKLQLTKEEIESITSENDIYVHIVGVNYDEENLYKIDITEGTLPTYNGGEYLYGSDLENRVVGVDLTMEWRYSENDDWTSYAKSSPDLTGDKTVQVRVGATGTKLPSPSATFTFTQDVQADNRKYIPASHLTVERVSTEATNNAGAAKYAIDGNYNTRWHSAWNGTDTQRFIVIKIDKPVYLSAVEFVPAGGGNGKIYDGTIYGSMDGENWVILSQKTGLTYTNQANTIDQAIANIKNFEIEDVTQVQYVKIVADRTNGNWFTARGFNLYQDITKNPHPTAGIGYSTTDPTNKDVVARLVNTSTNVKITNNDGNDTYTFTENGEFTFEFIDEETGHTGSATASVDWIDKKAPTGEFVYSPSTPTNKEVSVKLVPSEDVTITNRKINSDAEDFDTNVDPFIVIFSENGEYTFEFVDKAGNTGSATAKVDWIDKVKPTATIKYNILETTNGPVTVLLTDYSEKITITNNDGKNTYTFTENGEFTFEFVDEAGNTGSVTAKVDWIESNDSTVKVSYSTTELTNQDVVVTLVYGNEEITVTNNDGKNTYTFTENGEFTFEFVDEDGNTGSVTAKVTWIDKDAPTAKVSYSIEESTNKDVVVTLVDESEEITITNNAGKNTYTFKTNGEFTFEFVDKAGNIGSATAKVTYIDKVVPTAKVNYSTKETTNGNVVVTLVDESEKITITNNAGKNTYTFKKNGEFTFEFVDKAGNKGSVTAKVDWIVKEETNKEENKNHNDNSNKENNVVVTRPVNGNQNSGSSNNDNSQSSNSSESTNNATSGNESDKKDNNEVDNKDNKEDNKDSKDENTKEDDSEKEDNTYKYYEDKKQNNNIKIILIITLIIVFIIISEVHIYKK